MRVVRTRAKDWLIGAAATALVLVAAATAFWLLASDPAGTDDERAGAPPVGGDRPGHGGPPGHLGAEEVWLPEVVLDAGRVVIADATLREVRAVGRNVVAGPEGLLAARLSVDGTVPFAVVARELGADTVVRPAGGGQVMVVRTVEALGRELRVVATGTVHAESGRLVVEPRSIDVGGPGFLADAIAAVVRRLVTIEHEVAGLPDGLVLQEVTVREGGFRVRLRGENVRLVS